MNGFDRGLRSRGTSAFEAAFVMANGTLGEDVSFNDFIIHSISYYGTNLFSDQLFIFSNKRVILLRSALVSC